MTSGSKKLIIVGTGTFAQVALEYFEQDSPYLVDAFAVERAFLTMSEAYGRPVVAFENIADRYPPSTHDVFVAITYNELNRVRKRLVVSAKEMGYETASYTSSHALIAQSAQLGQHCFIFEDNVVQPFVNVANNVILWSGNHIGHHTSVGENCFISSHVVISGNCEIGPNCFIGVNATIANNVVISPDCWIGPGVVITQNTEPGQMFPAQKAAVSRVSSIRFFQLDVKDQAE